MSKNINLIIILLLPLGMNGCFLLSSTANSSGSNQASTASSASYGVTNSTQVKTAQLLVNGWSLQRVYRIANAQILEDRDCSGASSWMIFKNNGTLSQKGILGTNDNQQLRWNLYGTLLTIKGNNITFADGNLSDSKVEYTIEYVTENELHLSRQDGKLQNGATITRHLIFITY